MGAKDHERARKKSPAGTRSFAKEQRRRVVATLIKEGVPYPEIYNRVCRQFGVKTRTVQLDVKLLGDVHRRFVGDEHALAADMQAAIDRMKARGAAGSQRADEYLLRLFGETAAKARLKQLGVRLEERERRLLEIEVEEAEARVRLANARAELAETGAKRGGAGVLIVQLGDTLAGDMDPEALAALTPSPLSNDYPEPADDAPDDGPITLGTGGPR